MDWESPLHNACKAWDVSAVERALAAGESPNRIGLFRDAEFTDTIYGRAPLHTICSYYLRDRSEEQAVACVRALIDAGADVAALRDEGPGKLTPLHDAVRGGWAWPNSLNTEGRGLPKLAQALIEAGANVEAQTGSGPTSDGTMFCTPLRYATMHGSVDCVAVLLAAGADINTGDRLENFMFPLMSTVSSLITGDKRMWSRTRIAPLLLRAGVAIPPPNDKCLIYGWHVEHPYMIKVRAAGGFAAHEKQHRAQLVATFAPKLDHLLLKELVPLVIDYYAHVGLY